MSRQMRMIYPYPKGRLPQDEKKVTFKLSKEFKLKDFVVDKRRDKSNPCLFELSLIFSCMKENSFEEKMCHEEISKFHNCYMQYYKEEAERKKSNLGSPNNMTAKEVNKIMASYKRHT